MADKTTHFGLILPGGDEFPDSAPLAENFATLDTEVFKRGKAINGIEVNENGDFILEEVPYARNLVTDEQQSSSGEYLFRTTGGDASLSDGEATLVGIHGRMRHDGIIQETLDMTVHSETRPAPEEGEAQDPGITATLDRETFLEYVENPASITVVLSYTDAWSANPTLYGVTVEGTPISGDSITIEYIRADRGTITPAYPTAFRSTGWNLYNHTLGYARVKKYSDVYNFIIGGTYTSLQFSETIDGVKTEVTVSSRRFTIAKDGYIWVTGGNDTDTYICMTWSDWTTGPEGGWKAYSETSIDLSDIIQIFPNGLCKVGAIIDEINLSAKTAVRRIGRMAYSDSALADLIAAGTSYEADEDYIYYVLDVPVVTALTEPDYTVTDKYTANDHGLEIIDSTSDVAPFVQTLYGENLVDKLRTDIPNTLATHAQQIADIRIADSPATNPTTLSALQSFLTSLTATMSEDEAKHVSFVPQFTDTIFTAGVRVYGTLFRRANSTLVFIGGTINGNDIEISCNNGTWYVKSLRADVTALNSNMTPETVETGIAGVLAEKTGKLVVLEFIINTAITSDSKGWVEIGVLPNALKPRRQTPFTCYDNSATTKDMNVPLQMRITGVGIIQVFFWENVSASVKPYGTIAYFTA